MRITRLQIENFRSIRSLDLKLEGTTVFFGANDAGKSAIIDALRMVLSRRWGQRGTGFTEHDIHRADDRSDPRTTPPVAILLVMEEPASGAWDADMVAALEDIIAVLPDGRNVLSLRVTCAWSEEKEAFDPVWQFLDAAGAPLPERRRAVNLTGFFSYVPFFWLEALRDAATEFTPRATHWGRLLRAVRIPDELETEALQILAELDARIASADPRLQEIANVIGQATNVAIGEGPGAARLSTLPMAIEEMLQRTGIVIRNEALRPWLPLAQHGQGLQSLAVIFLFQAAAMQQLAEAERPGTEPVFAIEEAEAHLHPQAARTLWDCVNALPGQKLMTTHSPYFVQFVPLRSLRRVCLRNGCTAVESIPEQLVSPLPWNNSVEGFARGGAGRFFRKDVATGRVAAVSWFDEAAADRLEQCYQDDPDSAEKVAAVRRLRHNSRILPSAEDEEELGFHGRRLRGEIFFAHRWVIVEGITEHLLLHALGKAFNWTLDAHGVCVIDFTQSGSAAVYPALAEAFNIPWHMIVDGDPESEKFRQNLLDRGFTDADISNRFTTLTAPNDLEDQLIANGHEQLLRQIISETSGRVALTCPLDEFRARLKNKKTRYMASFAPRVAADPALAARMPAPFVSLITALRDGTA